MQKFKVISEEVTGEINVTTDTQFNSIKADRIIISENVRVRLYGSVVDVVLKKGAMLFLHGKIHGKLENQGGEVFTYFQ